MRVSRPGFHDQQWRQARVAISMSKAETVLSSRYVLGPKKLRKCVQSAVGAEDEEIIEHGEFNTKSLLRASDAAPPI